MQTAKSLFNEEVINYFNRSNLSFTLSNILVIDNSSQLYYIIVIYIDGYSLNNPCVALLPRI